MNPNVCMIVYPLGRFSTAILSKFLRVIAPSCQSLYIITENYPIDKLSVDNINVISLSKHPALDSFNPYKRIAIHIVDQFRIIFHLMRISKNIDILLLPLDFSMFLLPMLFIKCLRKKIIVCATGSSAKSSVYLYRRGKDIAFFFNLLERIGFSMSNKIVAESPFVSKFLDLNKYASKLFLDGALFVDTLKYNYNKSRRHRKNKIAFVGRFTGEKGIINFLDAIPIILSKKSEIKFLIAGMGPLYRVIEKTLREYKNNVKYIGWVSQDAMPNFLSDIEILVLPSYTEGLPNIALESMAAGALIIATPVGGLPDLVKDLETGFILKNNSPECIAQSVLMALDLPISKLDGIALNASNLITEKYSIEACLMRYRRLLNGC